jgi:hypothetical protein
MCYPTGSQLDCRVEQQRSGRHHELAFTEFLAKETDHKRCNTLAVRRSVISDLPQCEDDPLRTREKLRDHNLADIRT